MSWLLKNQLHLNIIFIQTDSNAFKTELYDTKLGKLFTRKKYEIKLPLVNMVLRALTNVPSRTQIFILPPLV